MEDPTQCHPHSNVPDAWPSLPQLLGFRDRVRQRVAVMYEKGNLSQKEKRALWLGYEHEVMHIETLLYMLIQSPKTRPPPYMPIPDWRELAKRGAKPAMDESMRWQYFPGGQITMGLDDPEDDSVPSKAPFGWDNENPRRTEVVKPFLASKRPITNGEYAIFLHHTNGKAPPSWSGTYSNWTIKTVFGPVPLSLASDWPVMASYDDLSSYAQWKGGRLPTEGELRLLYDYLHMKDAVAQRIALNIDAVNGHLTQDGVNTTPPSDLYEPAATSSNRTNAAKTLNGNYSSGSSDGDKVRDIYDEVYVDMTGKNIGFRHWHPLPLPAANKLSTGSDGGAWEWTSTTFARHDGWIASKVYPGYSGLSYRKSSSC
jgi:L-histidine Nalpha-methyltransferase / hercynylcysteine S-oxide synthase